MENIQSSKDRFQKQKNFESIFIDLGDSYQEKLFMMLKSKFFGTELKEFFFALRSLFDER